MKKLKNLLMAFLTNFMIVCFVVLFAQVFIGALIFGQKSVVISHFYIQIPILVLVSILLTLFYQINNITVTVQSKLYYKHSVGINSIQEVFSSSSTSII